MKPKTSCSMSKNDEKIHLFFKRVFFQNEFIVRWMQFWQTDRTFPAQLREMIWKNVHKSCKNFSKLFSSESSHGDVESSMKARRTFFGEPAESFPLDIQTKTICKFCKKLSPESFHWNWEFSFDNSATFLARIGQKNSLCPKMKKKLELKLFFVKMLFWTRKMQF